MDMERTGQEVPHSEAAEEDDLEITVEEGRKCVERFKMRKAPGECGVIPETLQAGGEGVMKWLLMLFKMVWRVGVAPDDRRKAQMHDPHLQEGQQVRKHALITEE